MHEVTLHSTLSIGVLYDKKVKCNFCQISITLFIRDFFFLVREIRRYFLLQNRFYFMLI